MTQSPSQAKPTDTPSEQGKPSETKAWQVPPVDDDKKIQTDKDQSKGNCSTKS
jgi:hypothetical protein